MMGIIWPFWQIFAILTDFLIFFTGASRYNAHKAEEILRFVPQKTLKVADESVDISLAGGLMDNVFVIVVAQTSR